MEDMREDKDFPEEDKEPQEAEVPFEEDKPAKSEEKPEEAAGEIEEKAEETEEKSEVTSEEATEEKPEETSEEKSEEETEEKPSEEATEEKPSEEEPSEEATEEKPSEEATEETAEAKSEEKPEEASTEVPQEEPVEKKHYGKFIAAAAIALAVLGGAGYIGTAQQYNTKFFPHTSINYIDVSNLTLGEVEEKLDEGVADYTLNIVTRTGDEAISGRDIGLELVYDDSMENWLNEQNPYLWGMHLFQNTAYTIDTMISYDPDLLNEAVNDLDCMDPSVMTAPVDAAISDYNEETGSYEIVPEIPGTIIDKSKLIEALDGALVSMRPEIVLADTDAYVEAAVTSENEELLARLEDYNQYAGMTVIYHFGDEEEVLDGSRLHEWISSDDDGNIVVDRDAVAEYVKYLAEKYDTTSQARDFKTTYGSTVNITKGNYGWKISQSKETDALVDIILSGEGEEREPIYQQTAVLRGEKDYGDTYVEINLTAQHLYYYKNGSLVIESDLVSGNESNGNATPDGAYYLAYKQRNAVLRGQRRADGSYEYESPVSYWMPFNGGIGLHDATWRGSFGGSIYKTNGSHGCINLPFSVAKTIYENIDAGTPVFCYRLGSTEPSRTATSGSSSSSRSSSSSSSSTTSSAPAVQETAPAIQPIEETSLISEAVEVPAETNAASGSSNVIVAGQSKKNEGPGSAQETAETSPVVVAGSSETSEQAAAPAETQAAAPVETQAAASVETQAAAPIETQAAAPASAEVSMEAPGE